MTDFSKEVSNGVAFFDEKEPQWREMVTEPLDMKHGDFCPGGQIARTIGEEHGQEWGYTDLIPGQTYDFVPDALRHLAMTGDEAIERGLMLDVLTVGPGHSDWDDLQAAWEYELFEKPS